MKIFFDTEFYENGRTIDLISIGMVREDGLEYYAEAPNAKHIASRIPWLRENVLPHLIGSELARDLMAQDIISFVGEKPEFWADYCSYDWVVLCQLFGTMMDLPKGWPMFCMDIRQLIIMRGAEPIFPKQENEHNALADARHAKLMWEHLR